MDLIIKNAISGDLPQNLRFYPIKMVQNLKEATGGLVNLDIVDYAKKEIEASKDRHSQYKDKLIVLDDIRDDKISEIVKNPKLKGNLSKEIEAINSEMEELRDAIWSERNLQSRLNQYLNEKNKE